MEQMNIAGQTVRVYRFDTVVVGSGCAGFNAADTLFDLGQENVALITEGVNMGTSRNAGSDKQTYYKLALCSDASDSVFELARDLFDGGSVNGDTALAEAAGSVRSFMKLVNLGVPFPTNQYGEYVGYKTDHDPRQRATSCGPLTSKIMTEHLEKSVRRKNIPIFDGFQAVRLLSDEKSVYGLLALDKSAISPESWGICAFLSNQVILATGGPAIAYGKTVYPESQTGSTGLALEAGAKACNLQEWQYGLSSVKFRWNVSGTYQQVIPRYISVDQNGQEREFLMDYLHDEAKVPELTFLKGYQWPFDTQKLPGSSQIDMCVFQETQKGNRVFLDYRGNPKEWKGLSALPEVARDYLEKSGAVQERPIDRLQSMNPDAVKLYASHGIDLYKEPLEIAVCAQHCNGGLSVDLNWQSSLNALYVVGEAAGTFGITRPGGSALNATQVGSQRAAEHIALTKRSTSYSDDKITTLTHDQTAKLIFQLQPMLSEQPKTPAAEQRCRFQNKMRAFAGHVRVISSMKALQEELENEIRSFWQTAKVETPLQFPYVLKNWEMLLTQQAMLSSMLLTVNACGSRGAALVINRADEPDFQSDLCYKRGNGLYRDHWVKTSLNPPCAVSSFVPVRPLPKSNDWFETVWKEYRAKRL